MAGFSLNDEEIENLNFICEKFSLESTANCLNSDEVAHLYSELFGSAISAEKVTKEKLRNFLRDFSAFGSDNNFNSKVPENNITLLFLYSFKTESCEKKRSAGHTELECNYYHNLKERRRNLLNHTYLPVPCESVLSAADLSESSFAAILKAPWKGPESCPEGDSCAFAHTKNEFQYHSEIYKTERCCLFHKDPAQHSLCPLAHGEAERRRRGEEGAARRANGLKSKLHPNGGNAGEKKIRPNAQNGGKPLPVAKPQIQNLAKPENPENPTTTQNLVKPDPLDAACYAKPAWILDPEPSFKRPTPKAPPDANPPQTPPNGLLREPAANPPQKAAKKAERLQKRQARRLAKMAANFGAPGDLGDAFSSALWNQDLFLCTRMKKSVAKPCLGKYGGELDAIAAVEKRFNALLKANQRVFERTAVLSTLVAYLAERGQCDADLMAYLGVWESFQQKLVCQKCHKGDPFYILVECGHRLCVTCTYRLDNYRCSVCDAQIKRLQDCDFD